MDAVSIVSQVSGAANLAGVVASYTEESALVTRIRALAESYSHSFGSYQEARKRFRQERAELTPLLAEYKEKLVGVGETGNGAYLLTRSVFPCPSRPSIAASMAT